MVLYYRRRGVLTPQRLLIWTIIFFGSSIILDQSYYTRTYVPLGTVMTITFILYWEGLVHFRQKNIKKAMFLWVLALVLVGISVIDQWQIQGVPALGVAIITSVAAFSKKCRPLIGWVKRKSWWFLLGIILIAPTVTQNLTNISWITVATIQIFKGFFSSYWDNCIGWLRFILAVNVGLLVLDWAFRSKAPMTFDRWMFINGFLTGIVCILYNSHCHVFFSKFVYLPTLMIIIGLGGIIEDFIIQRSLLIRLLSVYVAINILVSWANSFEHSNVKVAVEWLKTHMTQEDILLTFGAGAVFHYFDGEQLLPMAHPVLSTTNAADVVDLGKYIYSHPRGRILYFYDDQYGFRDWLCKKTLGVERYPAYDLWSYLKLRIPSTPVVPGLRQCGLVEFDHGVLLNGLGRLLKNGFDPWDGRAMDFLNFHLTV